MSRLEPGAAIPNWACGELVALVRTKGELSVVSSSDEVPDSVRCERGWRALAVEGPLDFELIGILASLARPLADAGVPIFSVSTFDTDYLLVREPDLRRAGEALTAAGHRLSGFEVA